MELAKGILTDAKGLVGISTEKTDKSFEDSEKLTDERHNWEVGAAGEKTPLSPFFSFEDQRNTANRVFTCENIV